MLWKNQLKKMNVTSSVADAMQRAQFWRQTATARDNEMIMKWVNGDLPGKFDELNSFFQSRLSGSGTRMEKEGIATAFQGAKSTKSNLDDAMNEQMFKDGHLSFADLASYVSKRKGETPSGEKEYIFKESGGQQLDNLTRIFNESQETTRFAQEKDMGTKFNTGMIDYNTYKGFLDNQHNLYDPASARAASINETRYRITPDFKLKELESMFRTGAFAQRNAEGGYDQEENLTGYIGALKDLEQRYGHGSDEQRKVNTMVLDADDTRRQFRFSGKLNAQATIYNNAYGGFMKAKSDYDTAVEQYRMNPTSENYAKVQNAYAPYKTSFDSFINAETDYKNLEREAGNLTKYGMPIITAKAVPGLTDITPIQTPTPAPDTSIVQPPVQEIVQPPAQITPPAPSYNVRQILNANAMKNISQGDYYKVGDSFFLRSGLDSRMYENAAVMGGYKGSYKDITRADNPNFEKILDVNSLNKYKKDGKLPTYVFKVGNDYYVDPTKKITGTTKTVTGWL